MSGVNNATSDNHMPGLSNRVGQGRYIQNIISQAHDIFPDHASGFARLPTDGNDEGSCSQRDMASFNHDHVEDDQLDDFGKCGPLKVKMHTTDKSLDRQLLGRPSTTAYNLGSSGTTPQVPFSAANVSSDRQPRILGDASHHFGAFAPRSEGYRPSQFAGNLRTLNQLNPSPATRSVFDRDGSHRIAELHRGSQLVTPPMYTG